MTKTTVQSNEPAPADDAPTQEVPTTSPAPKVGDPSPKPLGYENDDEALTAQIKDWAASDQPTHLIPTPLLQAVLIVREANAGRADAGAVTTVLQARYGKDTKVTADNVITKEQADKQ